MAECGRAVVHRLLWSFSPRTARIKSHHLSTPLCGRQAVFDYWVDVTQTEEEIRFGFEMLVVTPDFGVAQRRASFVRVPPGLSTQLDGILLISLDAGAAVNL